MRKNHLLLLLITIWSGGMAFAQVSGSKELLKQHVYTLAADSMKGRGINSPESRIAADYIVKQLELNGVKPFGGQFIYPFSFKQGAVRVLGNNIVGVVEGSDPILKSEYIVIGAHYDHVGYDLDGIKTVVYNGADDNASGVATIIEMGRILVQNQATLKRSVIIIAFDGEESGLKGSSALVKEAVFPIEKVKAMVSVDMVGMLKANKGLNLKGSATLDEGNLFFNELAKKYGIALKELGVVVENRTDTSPFGSLGIPAFAPTTGTLSPYHKPEDDANLLDYDGMVTVTDFLVETVIALSAKEAVVASSAFSVKAKHGGVSFFSSGVKVSAGRSYHSYPDEFYQAKGLFAAQVGVYGRVRLSKKFLLQPEIQYESLGSKTANGNMRIHAINTPCSILLDMISADMVDSHIYLFFGGYHSYAFAGKVGAKKVDFDNQINRTDYGINYGISMEVMRFQLGVTVKQGITDLLNSKVPGNIRTRAGFLSLGYKF